MPLLTNCVSALRQCHTYGALVYRKSNMCDMWGDRWCMGIRCKVLMFALKSTRRILFEIHWWIRRRLGKLRKFICTTLSKSTKDVDQYNRSLIGLRRIVNTKEIEGNETWVHLHVHHLMDGHVPFWAKWRVVRERSCAPLLTRGLKVRDPLGNKINVHILD